jgi:uncharacterized membrane protein
LNLEMNSKLNDRDIEKAMGKLLRVGVLSSALIVAAGAILYFIQHGNDLANYRRFIGEPKRFTELRSVWMAAFRGRGRSIIQLGLFILIATPIARIVFSVIGYVFEKDYLYVILTLAVLAIILINI